jgi:hypothetical protein
MMQRLAGFAAPVQCAIFQTTAARRHSRLPATATPVLPTAQVLTHCSARRSWHCQCARSHVWPRVSGSGLA